MVNFIVFNRNDYSGILSTHHPTLSDGLFVSWFRSRNYSTLFVQEVRVSDSSNSLAALDAVAAGPALDGVDQMLLDLNDRHFIQGVSAVVRVD